MEGVVGIALANFPQGKQIFVSLLTVVTFVMSGFPKQYDNWNRIYRSRFNKMAARGDIIF
jgi:hypothetical protein